MSVKGQKRAREERATSRSQKREERLLKRQRIRAEYRTLIDEVETKHEELVKPTDRRLKEHIKKAAELFDDVRDAREAVLDSELLNKTAQIAREQVNMVTVSTNAYDPKEVIERLKQKYMEEEIEEIDWNRLDRDVFPFVHPVPSWSTLLGPFDQPPKQRKARAVANQRGNRMEEAEEVTPQVLGREEMDVDQGTSHKVMQLYQKYENEPGRDLLESVVNPVSFPESIENLFHSAFLAKDGRIAFRTNASHPDQLAVFTQQPGNEVQQTEQFICKFDYATWKKVVQGFDESVHT